MIIRRQLYPHNKVPIKKPDDSGIEMRPIYKKVQPGSVSKLLNTAASGTSIVRDVETLLTPIHELHHRDEMNYTREQREQASKERTERNLWRNDEVMEMLHTMQQVKALDKLNDKTVKSENVFKDVEVIMHKNGFVKKSHVQIWTKWKFLKSTYMTSRRNRVMPRIIPPQVYEVIHQMITTNQNQGYNDNGNSTNGSIDGDTSSLNGGMVISGIDGGHPDAEANGEDDDSFGMAHPIFGFRLGLVKSEPHDTGYEPIKNIGSDNDPLEEQVKEEDNNADDKTNQTESPPQLPPRGRGRPPKHPPAATSTPNATTSPARNIQMPPLRVAPFANAIHSANALAVNRPPPPLTMPPTPRIHIANLSSLKEPEHIKGMRKILPKPTAPTPAPQQTPIVQSLRLAKEITAQTRSSSNNSPSYPKMKQIPMRKTPYSLRPDRAIPDLEGSPSPPPPAVERQSAKKFEDVPTTKHLTMQNSNTSNFQNNINRKRHFDWLQETSLPNKKAKYDNNMDDEEHHDTSKSKNEEDGKHYGKVLQNVIIDLSSSLRKMQTQMMRDFFNKQNELLQKEHEFQLQQDRMIMRAFQQQTQEIMSSVKQLVGTINNNKNETASKQAKPNGKYRILTKSKSSRELHEEMEDNYEDQQEEEEVQEQQQMEQEDEIYTDGEEQQEENEQEENDQEENDQEENDQEENDQEEQGQEEHDQEEHDHEEHDQIENGDDEENDQQEEQEDDDANLAVNNDDDEDSDDPQQDPIQMVSSELTED